MRILITVPWGERLGGAEVMLQTLLDGASAGGHEIELLFFADGPWPRELREKGFHVELALAGRIREPRRTLACLLAARRVLRDRRPDVIVNWIAKAQLYCGVAALISGMSDRVLWWQHEITAGHWMDRLATAIPARAVGCSSRAAADAQAELRPRRRTFVIAPGVKAPRSHSEREERSRGPLTVGIVGRLQPWKGQDRLLRAQVLLAERGHELRTLIVGGDAHGLSSAYAAEIPLLVERLGLSDSVTLTGQVPDAGSYIDEMDVLVNASDPEPFGIVLLEAMARGVAVVAVASGGPLEIVLDGVSGVLARSGEPAALADAIEPLLADPELRARLGRAGRERFEERFTDDAMRAGFFAVLEQLRATA